jgi:hypothetical protein
MTVPNEVYEFNSLLNGDVDKVLRKHHRPHERTIENFAHFIIELDAAVKTLKSTAQTSDFWAGTCTLEARGKLIFPKPFRHRPAVVLSSLCYTFDEGHEDEKLFIECCPYLTSADKTGFSYDVFSGKLAHARHAGWHAVNELHYVCAAS